MSCSGHLYTMHQCFCTILKEVQLKLSCNTEMCHRMVQWVSAALILPWMRHWKKTKIVMMMITCQHLSQTGKLKASNAKVYQVLTIEHCCQCKLSPGKVVKPVAVKGWGVYYITLQHPLILTLTVYHRIDEHTLVGAFFCVKHNEWNTQWNLFLTSSI